MRITKSLLQEIYVCKNCASVEEHMEKCVLRNIEVSKGTTNSAKEKLKIKSNLC